MADQYQTIATLSEGIYKEKGSRFLSFAIPVNNIEDVNRELETYRKTYHDARHCCYAYVLGAGDGDAMGCMGTEFRANDDGEPSGTAGRPILGQINSKKLTNILVIVVRYFGGILLGTGGLIVAYKEATADALNQAEIVTRAVLIRKELEFEYAEMSKYMKMIKESNATILEQSYTDEGRCKLVIEIPKANA